MDVLSEWRYCLQVASRHETSNRDDRWRWAIRRKVLRWSIARLERAEAPASPARRSAALSIPPADQRTLEATHPLLRPISALSLPAFEPGSAWRTALRARVTKYMTALKARRAS